MTARYIIGDTRAVLATLEPASVDLILSSPPFLALRSYLPAGHPDKAAEIGSEATPGAYIDTLLDVVEACARVLAPHGSMMFELGDTYAGSGGAGGDYNAEGLRDGQPSFKQQRGIARRRDYSPERGGGASAHFDTPPSGGPGWPLDRSLCLIPELFRVSLVYGFNPLTGRQTPRWRARNVIRWCRPNPPVGALGDKFRPATSELVVVCRNRRYFDLDAVRTPAQQPDPFGNRDDRRTRVAMAADGKGDPGHHGAHEAGAPPLDWWKIPTQPYEGAHYATWPEQLCVIPVKAMSPARVCRRCGKPSERIVTKQYAAYEREALAIHLREQREAKGLSRADIAAYFPSVTGGLTGCVTNWESNFNVPTAEQWPILKSLLGLSDEFDALIVDRHWTEPTATQTDHRPNGQKGTTRASTPGLGRGFATRTQVIRDDLGWSDCGHGSYACSACGVLVPLDYAVRGPRESQGSEKKIGAQSILAESVEVAGEQAQHAGDLRDVQRGIHGASGGEMLHPQLLGEARPQGRPSEHHHSAVARSRSESDPSRLYPSVGADRNSRSKQERLHDGASACDAEPHRPPVGANGVGASPQRGEGRQSDRESGDHQPCAAERLGDLPALPEGVPGSLVGYVCPCGSRDIRYVADHWRPGVVLDPFAGSGTTLRVATGHGRDAIGIDLDQRNAELALGRVGPLMLTVERHDGQPYWPPPAPEPFDEDAWEEAAIAAGYGDDI